MNSDGYPIHVLVSTKRHVTLLTATQKYVGASLDNPEQSATVYTQYLLDIAFIRASRSVGVVWDASDVAVSTSAHREGYSES